MIGRKWALPRYRLFCYRVVVRENRFEGDVVIENVGVINSAISMIAVVIVHDAKDDGLRR